MNDETEPIEQLQNVPKEDAEPEVQPQEVSEQTDEYNENTQPKQDESSPKIEQETENKDEQASEVNIEEKEQVETENVANDETDEQQQEEQAVKPEEETTETYDEPKKEKMIQSQDKNKINEDKKEEKPKKKDKKHKKNIPSLDQSKSTEADPEIEKKNGHLNESSVDIDSYTNKMSYEERKEILNNKKKKGNNKRKQSATLLKLQQGFAKQMEESKNSNDVNDIRDPTKQSSIVTLIGGSSHNASTLSLRQRAMLSFQQKMNNQQKWKTEQIKMKPLKSQKSKSVLDRMAKFSNAQNALNQEETWRKKLVEREEKNKVRPSPSHSRSNTKDDGTIITASVIENDDKNNNGSPNRLSPKRLSSPKHNKSSEREPAKHHKRHTSASQQAIIARLTASADQWKKKYNKKNDGDTTLQQLRNKKSKQDRQKLADDHQKKIQLQNMSWKNKVKKNNNNNKPKIDLNDKKKQLELKENEWKERYNSSARKETEELKENIHSIINENIDKFLEITNEEKFDENAWKRRLQKESNPQNDHLTLLNLQIRKLNSKMSEEIEKQISNHKNEQYRSVEKHKERISKDIETIELAFEERLSHYQTELLNIQNRFEAQIAYYKDLRQENDSKSFQAMDPEKKKKVQEIMQQQVNERKSKIANKKFLNDATNNMNRENCFKVLRDLNILTDDDTILNMNNCHILQTLTDSKRKSMRDILKYCIMDNPRLVSIQFANSQLTDEWFINDILPTIEIYSKLLTELILDSNKLTDKSIIELTKYVISNPPCLRVLKFGNLYNDITTPVIKQFLNALESNTQIIKLVMDTRFYDQRDKLQKILDRNWKRYAQERRLKKTLLTQIQNRKQQKSKK